MSPPIAFCSALTASPFDHSFRVRPAYCASGLVVGAGAGVVGAGAGAVVAGAGAVTAPIRAYQTLRSTTPVTVRPLAFWYSLTRVSVAGPKEPSTVSLPMAFCRALTAVPVEPRLSTTLTYGDSGLVRAGTSLR